jgi:hypothetical protein
MSLYTEDCRYRNKHNEMRRESCILFFIPCINSYLRPETPKINLRNHLKNKIKKDAMDWACSMNGGEEECI